MYSLESDNIVGICIIMYSENLIQHGSIYLRLHAWSLQAVAGKDAQ